MKRLQLLFELQSLSDERALTRPISNFIKSLPGGILDVLEESNIVDYKKKINGYDFEINNVYSGIGKLEYASYTIQNDKNMLFIVQPNDEKKFNEKGKRLAAYALLSRKAEEGFDENISEIYLYENKKHKISAAAQDELHGEITF